MHNAFDRLAYSNVKELFALMELTKTLMDLLFYIAWLNYESIVLNNKWMR